MDLFEQTLFPTASPMTLKSDPSAESVSQHSFIFHDNSLGESGIREEARRQWESLKPVIQRIYIDENKPFPYLAKILRDEHHFEPTKRQFSRQVKKWDFRKNVSRCERRTIMQSLPGTSGNPASEFQDRRVGQGKLKNWQRRYRGEEKERLTIPRQEHENKGDTSKTGVGIAKAETCLEPEPCKEPPATTTATEDGGNSTQQARLDSTAMIICQDSWPFDWATVDIPGSPGLSRLFKRLEIESSHVPAFSLDGSESEDPTCLSKKEIQKVFNCGTIESHGARLSRVQALQGHMEGCSAGQAPHFPWRNPDIVFCGYSESPLREIYVFPSAPQQKVSAKLLNTKMTVWEQLQIQQADFKTKYAKLKRHFSADHPAVIAILQKLADLLFGLGECERAESLYRELVDLYRRIHGPNHLITLQACHVVVKALTVQGHFLKAKALNDNLRSATSKLVQADHPLAIDVAENYVWLSELLGHRENAENVRREILQILLTTHGPRHSNSMRALSLLGLLIARNRSKDGEMLLRTSLQLSLEDPESDRSCSAAILAMSDLADALYMRGAPEESLRIASRAVERFGPLLGANHPYILGLEHRRAWSLLETGELIESQKLFENLAALYSVGGEVVKKNNLVEARLGLAHVLLRMGNVESATDWYEKCFGLGISIYLIYPKTLVRASYELADWYEDHRLFADALRVYQHLVSEIRESGDCYGMIAKLESEIRRIEEKAQGDARSSSNTSEYESDSDGTDWSNDGTTDEIVDKETEASVETSEVGEGGSEQQNEDWDFFHAGFQTP